MMRAPRCPMPPPFYRKGSVEELEYQHLETRRKWEDADEARFNAFFVSSLIIAGGVFLGFMVNLTGFPY
jgi:hypothetical protein